MIKDCKIINFQEIKDETGDISVIENSINIPFLIKRVYYLHNIKKYSTRGGHAHKELKQLLIPVSGSFEVNLDDGYQIKTIFLNNPNQGLYICPYIWRTLHKFDEKSICLVLASEIYDENDYIRNYQTFQRTVNFEKKNSIL